MILTKEYMREYGACAEGYELAITSGHIGKDIDEAIAYCRQIGREDFAIDLEATKLTPAYVRHNGKRVINMNKYKVFNPLTGQYTTYDSLGDAKKGLVEVANQLLAQYEVSVAQVISNEKGDEAWIPIPSADWAKVVISGNPVP